MNKLATGLLAGLAVLATASGASAQYANGSYQYGYGSYHYRPGGPGPTVPQQRYGGPGYYHSRDTYPKQAADKQYYPGVRNAPDYTRPGQGSDSDSAAGWLRRHGLDRPIQGPHPYPQPIQPRRDAGWRY